MYLGKRKIHNLAEYEERRKECIAYKSDATFTAFSELEDIINKSQRWFSQRLHGWQVLNKSMSFKPSEYHQLAEAFRDIARRLEAHADEIDSAKDEDF